MAGSFLSSPALAQIIDSLYYRIALIHSPLKGTLVSFQIDIVVSLTFPRNASANTCTATIAEVKRVARLNNFQLRSEFSYAHSTEDNRVVLAAPARGPISRLDNIVSELTRIFEKGRRNYPETMTGFSVVGETRVALTADPPCPPLPGRQSSARPRRRLAINAGRLF